MTYKGNRVSLIRIICLILYKCIAIHLPCSYSRYGGKVFKAFRYLLCNHIFDYCGKNVNVEHGANFGNGFGIRIGDNSGLGVNCLVPNDLIVGNNVMMVKYDGTKGYNPVRRRFGFRRFGFRR